MSSKYRVIDAKDATPRKAKSPVTQMLEDLDGEYLTVGQIAERYDVHKETIRRLIKSTDKQGQALVNAPSKAIQQGNMVIYLFTQEDVVELDEYMSKRGHMVKK